MKGRRAHEIGQEHESLAVNAFNAPWVETPEWFLDIRAATNDEDAQGIDVVVTTDVGDIGFQVKSSRRFVEKHQERYGDIPVVIIRLGDTEKKVRGRILRTVEAARAAMQQEQAPEASTPAGPG